jgi:hypothetical protein
MKEPVALPPVLADQVTHLRTITENLKIPVPIDLMARREDLHEAVRSSARDLADIESRGNTIFPLSDMHNSLNACHPSQHVSWPFLCSCSTRHLYTRCRHTFHHCHGPAYTDGVSPPHPAVRLTSPMGLEARTRQTAHRAHTTNRPAFVGSRPGFRGTYPIRRGCKRPLDTSKNQPIRKAKIWTTDLGRALRMACIACTTTITPPV